MLNRSLIDSLGSHYEDRVIAYFDILGWKEIIVESIQDPRKLVMIEKALARGERLRRAFDGERYFEISQFSDHIVISAPADTDYAHSISRLVSHVCLDLLKNDFLIRGAIACGKLVHIKEKIYGPALAEAYWLESTVAVYPRILVASSASDLFQAAEEWETLTRVDFDGLQILDIIRSHPSPKDARSICNTFLNRYGPFASKRKKMKHAPLNIRAKYEWTISYLRSCLNERHTT
jgi:hypothetical protein